MISKSYLAYRELTIPPNGQELVVPVPNANFVRCTDSSRKRFFMSTDGAEKIPFWGGQKWTLEDGDTFNLIALSTNLSEPLKVELYFGLGNHQDQTFTVHEKKAFVQIDSPDAIEDGVTVIPDGGTVRVHDADEDTAFLMVTVLDESVAGKVRVRGSNSTVDDGAGIPLAIGVPMKIECRGDVWIFAGDQGTSGEVEVSVSRFFF